MLQEAFIKIGINGRHFIIKLPVPKNNVSKSELT